MKIQHLLIASPSMLCLAVALMLVGHAAYAQEVKAAKPDIPASNPETASHQVPALVSPQGQEAVIAEDEELLYEPLQVGDATQGLLAWQSRGDIASSTPRPIAGAVANRSYERYLKSFEFPIPERLGSTVKSSNGSGSGTSTGVAR